MTIYFAYNIMGWLKAINSETLNETRDIGKDGARTGNVKLGLGWNQNNNHQIVNTTLHQSFSRDIYGGSYHYFEGDYKSISPLLTNEASFQAKVNTSSALNSHSADMFNGAISRHTTALVLPDNTNNLRVQPQTYVHRYDQLGRLTESIAFRSSNNALINNNWDDATFDSQGQGLTNKQESDYYTAFQYDASGNITSLKRNGFAASGSTEMDHLKFEYDWKDRAASPGERNLQNSNRLYHVTDLTDVSNPSHKSAYADDMDDNGTFTAANIETSNNYEYDEIGNMVRNNHDEIQLITYTAARKVKTITRTSNSLKPDLEFVYNGFGQRIAKIIKPRAAVGGGAFELAGKNTWKVETYAKDASGTTIATYQHSFVDATTFDKSILKDITLYGASRLGVEIREIEMDGQTVATNRVKRDLGNKRFHMVNHLGSVMSTITDRKICTQEIPEDLIVETGFEGNDYAFFDRREEEYYALDAKDEFNTSSTDWILVSGESYSVTFNEKLEVNVAEFHPDGDGVVKKVFNTEAGKLYKLSFDYTRDEKPVKFTVANPGGTPFEGGQLTQSSGTHVVSFTAQSSETEIEIGIYGVDPTEDDKFTLDNVELAHKEYIESGYSKYTNNFVPVNGGAQSIYLKPDNGDGTETTKYGPYFKMAVKPGDNMNLVFDAYVESGAYNKGGQVIYELFDLDGNRLEWKAYTLQAQFGFPFDVWETVNYNYTVPNFGEDEMILQILPWAVSGENNATYFDNLKVIIQSNSPQNYYLAEQVSATDYYAYGMQMPGRGYNVSEATFGYQGSRQDKEMYGNGNHYTTDFRQLDSRIGRWTQPDPVFQPWQSPYNSMDGDPINLNDPLGLKPRGEEEEIDLPDNPAWGDFSGEDFDEDVDEKKDIVEMTPEQQCKQQKAPDEFRFNNRVYGTGEFKKYFNEIINQLKRTKTGSKVLNDFENLNDDIDAVLIEDENATSSTSVNPDNNTFYATEALQKIIVKPGQDGDAIREIILKKVNSIHLSKAEEFYLDNTFKIYISNEKIIDLSYLLEDEDFVESIRKGKGITVQGFNSSMLGLKHIFDSPTDHNQVGLAFHGAANIYTHLLEIVAHEIYHGVLSLENGDLPIDAAPGVESHHTIISRMLQKLSSEARKNYQNDSGLFD